MAGREKCLTRFKRHVLEVCPEEFLAPPPLIGDLLSSGKGVGLAVLVVPIDLQAPRGRLILPQVQTIRDCLDSDAAVAVVKEREYPAFLEEARGRRLTSPSAIPRSCSRWSATLPLDVPCTTFSILFARSKGDLVEMARGAAVLTDIGPDDRILIAEACSHHAIEDDIGRVKIPRWIRQYVGADVAIDTCAGRDYPEDLAATGWSSTAAAACSPAGRCSPGSRRRAAKAWPSRTTGWPSPFSRELSSAPSRLSRPRWTRFRGRGSRITGRARVAAAGA